MKKEKSIQADIERLELIREKYLVGDEWYQSITSAILALKAKINRLHCERCGIIMDSYQKYHNLCYSCWDEATS